MKPLQEFSYQAPLMGTELEVVFIASAANEALFASVLAFGKQLEATFSRFLPESELSQLNQQRSIILSPSFLDVWKEACKLYAQTNGAFNPLLSPVHLGYQADFKTQHQNFVAKHDDFEANFERITFDPETNRLSLHPGQILDFGGFLKGYATQKMRDRLSDIPGGIINLGGDITV